MFARTVLSLLTVVAVVKTAAGFPPQFNTRSSNCTTVEVRKEWRNLTSAEQVAYLDAEICLMNLPAQTGLAAVTSRYSDLEALHQNLTTIIHDVGQFLPWHRYFVHVHHEILKTQCNYGGPVPWWDERIDSGHFENSTIFSPNTFGSLGASSCVTDGYFANTTLYIGPGTEETEHCLSRNVNDNDSAKTSSTYVDNCNAYSNYTSMWECVVAGPHAGGHLGVGGVMSNMDSSVGDPSFFLHHGFIDRNWWTWQNIDPANNLYQISGYTTQQPLPSGGYEEVTLDYVMSSWGVLPDVTVYDVMDAEGGYLCYEYDY